MAANTIYVLLVLRLHCASCYKFNLGLVVYSCHIIYYYFYIPDYIPLHLIAL